MTYRDSLGAAHARIAELERERTENVAPTREAARLIALERERHHVLATLAEPEGELAGLLRWKIYVPFGIAAVAFLLDGDPVFAGVAVVLAFVVRWVARALVASSRKNAERHLALLEAEIARLC